MSKKNKYSNLFKNVGVLTIGNFASKLLAYFLLPLYTSYLTTSEFGTYDLFSTTINLILPILTVNVTASIMRFSLDKNSNIKEIISTGFIIIFKGFLILLPLLIVNKLFNIFDIINQYMLYFILLYLTSVLLQSLTAVAKGLEDLKSVALSGVVHTFWLLTLNILFLVVFNMKLDGYFLANIISSLISIIFLFLKLKIWKYLSNKNFSKDTEKNLISYGAPLIITSISWWINNVSDRYIVTFFCGIAMNGIYSVAYKIPSILSIFQTIFNQAWQISTVNEYDKNDSKGFFKNIYNMFNVVNVFACSILILFTKVIAYFLYAKDFYTAWKYVPFLMISVVFGSLIGVIDGIFQAVKDSKIQSKSVAVGAITNIVLNIILVYNYGPIGAAISTAISYIITWIVSIINVRKYISLRIDLRKHLLSYFILIIQSIFMIITSNSLLLYFVQTLMVFLLFIIYKNEILKIIVMFINKRKKDI